MFRPTECPSGKDKEEKEMAGVINRAVAANGVIAFQDRQNPRLFEYFPGNGDAVLGDTLKSFECSYYGIGKTPQWVQAGQNYLNLAGGVVSGQMRFDATRDQLAALREEIGRVYEIDDAQLVPVILNEASAQPVFAQGVANLGGNSEYTFPSTVALGSTFNFTIDSGNSLFPQLIAGLNRNPAGVSSPTIGMNISGKLQLYGEPFEARLRADLKQVWEYVRDQVDVKANLGFFNLTSHLDRIAQDLQRESIIQMEFIEGRADSEFGLQLLESTRVVFEAINAQITSGEGMFKFDPNPDPQEPKDPEKDWFASLAPWSVGVNLSFIRNSFKQSITFDQTVKFQGLFTIPVSSSFNLGVICSRTTEHMFHDATLVEDGCITPQKLKDLQGRISKEVAKKEEMIQGYEDRLLRGMIDLKTFETLVAMLNTRMLTEKHESDRRSAEDIVREVEQYAYRHAYGRGSSVGGPLVWHVFEVGEEIGDAPGETNTVEFRNQSGARGHYRLKIGAGSWTNYELHNGEMRDHVIDRHSWNARNDGKVDIEYQRHNVPDSTGRLVWHAFEVGEEIGDASGKTNTVEFRNQSGARGHYRLKIGAGSWTNYELDNGEMRDHVIDRHSWNARNDGKVDIEYQRHNVPDSAVVGGPLVWHVFEVGEEIGDASGKTNTVQFRNQSGARGHYRLKIGAGSWTNYELGNDEMRDHVIDKNSWNARNSGKVDIEYERDNS
jgi:hypothetical protein